MTSRSVSISTPTYPPPIPCSPKVSYQVKSSREGKILRYRLSIESIIKLPTPCPPAGIKKRTLLTLSFITVTMSSIDSNDEIISLIRGRLELGRQRYGHGVILDDDTTAYGTERSSWTLMALEEALDLAVYLSARLLQVLRKEEEENKVLVPK